MLLDFAIVPAYVRCSTPCSSKSLKHLSARHSRLGTTIGVRRLDDPLLDQGGRRDDLSGAARLVRLGERSVTAVGGGRGSRVVRVEAGRGGHRQQVTGLRGVDDDGAALRPAGRHRLRQRLLGHVLDVAVDGEPHVGPGTASRSVSTPLGIRRPPALTLVGGGAVAAGEGGVQRVLDAAEPLAVGAHEPDDVGAHRPRRGRPASRSARRRCRAARPPPGRGGRAPGPRARWPAVTFFAT